MVVLVVPRRMMPARQDVSGATPSVPAVFGVILASRAMIVQLPVTLRLNRFIPSPSTVQVLSWIDAPEG